MIKANQYQVNWNLMTWIMPSNSLTWINYKLSSVGTYVLILPLSVIVTSFLYRESKVINMLAALFGVIGLLFTIVRGLRDGTLNEHMDLRVFTVYHEITLEAKREFFMAEYHKLVTDLGLISMEKLKYLNEYVDNNLGTINDKLKKIPAKEVKDYVIKVFEEVNGYYEDIINATLTADKPKTGYIIYSN